MVDMGWQASIAALRAGWQETCWNMEGTDLRSSCCPCAVATIMAGRTEMRSKYFTGCCVLGGDGGCAADARAAGSAFRIPRIRTMRTSKLILDSVSEHDTTKAQSRCNTGHQRHLHGP